MQELKAYKAEWFNVVDWEWLSMWLLAHNPEEVRALIEKHNRIDPPPSSEEEDSFSCEEIDMKHFFSWAMGTV